ncbi:PAS domain S-box protein [Hymenobacter sp. 5516J-16]|uniref:PAS domain S-box protein n=1 Tax=Hymenobacter sp. 5516J-16 TaxID=2932253 RepID=UPI001FD21A46|nr:PAS domain S-box protein [Hymenobacter sp. 5516J-16]UOQ77690.1 PAS domain S-box protein [Hymenobacter sp. 5516J-16]
MQRLVQDLQTHQIELEMQYEELLLAQAEAEASRAQYMDLYDFAPVGYCTLAPDGTLAQLNLQACQLLGLLRQQLQGRRLALFVTLAYRHQFAEFVERIRQRQERQVLAVEMRRHDGQVLYVRLEGVAVSAAEGTPLCRLALIDITEQRRARRELELSERRFRILFDQSQDGMLLLRDNRFVDCNPATLRLLGLTDKSQLLGQHASAFSPERQPDGRLSFTLAQQYWEQAVRQGHCRFEWCRHRTDGKEFWEDILLTAIPETDGHVMHASWRDITAEKETTRRIRESEERLQMALAASEAGVWTIEYATNEITWNQRARSICGLPEAPSPAPLQLLQEIIHPDDRALVATCLGRAAAEEAPLDLEHRLLWPDGSTRYVSAFGKVLREQGQPVRFVGLMRDITLRREAEEELGYKNRLLSHILQNLPVILSQLTTEGHFLSVEGEGLRRIGLRNNELVGGPTLAQAFPSLAESARRLLAGQTVTFLDRTEYEGKPVVFLNYGFFDAQRQQAVLFAIDVTESEERREKLRAEKEFTKSLLDNTIDCVIALDTDLRVTAWNNKVAAVLGRPEAEMLGLPFEEALPGIAQDPTTKRLVYQALAGEPAAHANWAEHHLPMIMDLNFIPLNQQGVRAGVLILARDVTERNALQAEATRLKLRQQQEVLSAILTTQEEERRRISESLHNGVGQLLYATRLNLDNLPPSEQTRTSQHLLSEAIRATRDISFELTPSILEDFGLELALRELVKRIPAQSLTVDLNLSGLHHPLPRSLETTIYRSVQELLNNVMKHAGAQEVFVQVAREDGQVYVSVEDDGRGFETEGLDPATGIGLAGIRTRVGLLGGTFAVQSRPGQGASITLTFPVS